MKKPSDIVKEYLEQTGGELLMFSRARKELQGKLAVKAMEAEGWQQTPQGDGIHN